MIVSIVSLAALLRGIIVQPSYDLYSVKNEKSSCIKLLGMYMLERLCWKPKTYPWDTLFLD